MGGVDIHYIYLSQELEHFWALVCTFAADIGRDGRHGPPRGVGVS